MKTLTSTPFKWSWAFALILLATTAPAGAQIPLQGALVLRPLTPGDITAYQLPPNTEVSGGLSAVGVGQPVYLEAEVNIAIPATNILGVAWAVTSRPLNSSATPQPSPLGTNVPIYEPADRLVAQVAGRALLRPDVAGQYTVTATISTSSSGTTNLTTTITAGTYLGVSTCALCHSGGAIATNTVVPWSQTEHASFFTRAIDGQVSSHYNQSCIVCHTVGYDTNALANNGGFDDVARTNGWVFPAVLTNGNFAAMPAALQNLANIQCENCHGPGSQHAFALGDTNLIGVSLGSGDCGQCHDTPPYYVQNLEWDQSLHAVTTRIPSGPGRQACVGCHTAAGFIGRISAASTTNTTYVAITCQTCHEPHGATIPAGNPHLLRVLTPVTLPDGTVLTKGGMGLLCMECHHSRADAATAASVYNSHFGPHDGPQADMLAGANAFTYGQTIPSSAHYDVVSNLCVTCHMQTVATNNPAYLHAGDHTFEVGWPGTATQAGVDLTAACQRCHDSQITDDFDFPLQDYDGDGVIEGVQTEVQNLLNKLGLLLPPVGQEKSTVTPEPTWTAPQLEAAYNYMFVQNDGSMGIHNTAYAVGILKASIANLTGDANNDGLPDAWQIQYFGSFTNPNAAPNATPAGDGVPNWMKYALGLNPLIPGLVLTNGVVWVDGKNLVNPPVNPGETNIIEIYTAAEVAFNTQTNMTYQIQSVSSLSAGWQNVGSPIEGTGAPVSYVTPTRNGVQMFFRVVHSP